MSLRAAHEARELLDGVLVPGLVNAHAHLDLAGGAALPASTDFTEWLLGVGSARGQAGDVAPAACQQTLDLACRGVTAIGDIDASGGLATQARLREHVQGLSYLEIVGVAADSARARLQEALKLADRLGGSAVVGLSPHAPYSVATEVLPDIVRAARHRGLRLAMHLAETPEETRYLLRGDGPFEDFLRVIGRGRPFASPPGVRPIAYAERTGLLAAGCLVIHGNDLDEEDLSRLHRHGSSVVYCHGTHAHFGRPPHRLGELLARGVNVALGTDSGLSNQGVDLLAELQRLHRDRPDLAPQQLLGCATVGGRRALGLPLTPADFTVGAEAHGLLLGPAPADLDRLDGAALAAWICSPEAQPLLTVHAGRLVPGPGACTETLGAFVDLLPGQG
ncbi:MAG: amidohydrolase family protein [Planctomycetota bacterium]